MQVHFTIYDDDGETVYTVKRAACYGAMNRLRDAGGFYKIGGNIKKMNHIVFKICLEPESPDPVDNLEYIKAVHSMFSDYIIGTPEEIATTKEVKVDLTMASGNVFLGIATLYRVFDEYDYALDTFKVFTEEYGIDPEIAVLTAQKFSKREGGSYRVQYTDGHTLFSEQFDGYALKHFKSRCWEQSQESYRKVSRYHQMNTDLLGLFPDRKDSLKSLVSGQGYPERDIREYISNVDKFVKGEFT